MFSAAAPLNHAFAFSYLIQRPSRSIIFSGCAAKSCICFQLFDSAAEPLKSIQRLRRYIIHLLSVI